MLHALCVSGVAARRAARTVGGYAIIVARIGTEGIGRANSNHRRFVTWRVNRSIDLVAVCILAIVAGGSDHYDSRVNQRTSGATDRIVLIRTDGRRSETHVDDADVVLVFVQRVI